jgi:hypothetical protein
MSKLLHTLSISAMVVLAALLLATVASADTAKPERVINERYSFGFTVEPASLVTFEKGGVGFSATHKLLEGTPDYGLLVFGSPYQRLSAADAKAAKLATAEEQVLAAKDAGGYAAWGKTFAAVCDSRGRKKAGEASIRLPDGATLKTPYYTWSQTVLGKTHYAMTYVVVHADAFVSVQAESSRPFTDAQLKWLSSKLELLEPVATVNKPVQEKPAL